MANDDAFECRLAAPIILVANQLDLRVAFPGSDLIDAGAGRLAIEPRRRRVHGSVGGVRVTAMGGDGERRSRGLAGVAIVIHAGSLDVLQILGESVDDRIELRGARAR